MRAERALDTGVEAKPSTAHAHFERSKGNEIGGSAGV